MGYRLLEKIVIYKICIFQLINVIYEKTSYVQVCQNAFGVDEKLSSRFLDHILELRQYHQTCSDNHLFTKHVQIRRSVDKNFVVIMYLFISNGKLIFIHETWFITQNISMDSFLIQQWLLFVTSALQCTFVCMSISLLTFDFLGSSPRSLSLILNDAYSYIHL